MTQQCRLMTASDIRIYFEDGYDWMPCLGDGDLRVWHAIEKWKRPNMVSGVQHITLCGSEYASESLFDEDRGVRQCLECLVKVADRE